MQRIIKMAFVSIDTRLLLLLFKIDNQIEQIKKEGEGKISVVEDFWS